MRHYLQRSTGRRRRGVENACTTSLLATTRWATMRTRSGLTVRLPPFLLWLASHPSPCTCHSLPASSSLCSSVAREGAHESSGTKPRIAHRQTRNTRYVPYHDPFPTIPTLGPSLRLLTDAILCRRLHRHGNRRRAGSGRHARPRVHHTASIPQMTHCARVPV